jgi:isopentenyl-diphosphate Delta-isomerase
MEREMEHIVIVDENDNLIGEEDKERCHDGNGILHRGFLAMVFNRQGELFLTRRSEGKRLWPGFWDGTVASHVINGEDYVLASKRRLAQEIGLSADSIKYLFKFQYYVRFGKIGSENEICAVTIVDNIDTDKLSINREEISAVKTISMQALMEELTRNKEIYTPWLILAVENMRQRGLFSPESSSSFFSCVG